MGDVVIESNFGPVGGFHGSLKTSFGDGIALYSYITADTLDDVNNNNYFNALRDTVSQGDIVYVGSTQLDDDSNTNEYTMLIFDAVPKSPSTDAVTVKGEEINAT